MSLWLLIAVLGLIKLPIGALMLWIPFRDDEAMRTSDAPGSAEEDGGSRTLPGDPLDPHPRRPSPGRPPSRRRGPHGSPPAPAPRRIRATAVGGRRVGSLR
jgi:hypothetical protein